MKAFNIIYVSLDTLDLLFSIRYRLGIETYDFMMSIMSYFIYKELDKECIGKCTLSLFVWRCTLFVCVAMCHSKAMSL